MSIERWHSLYNPKQFLSQVDVGKLIKRAEVDADHQVSSVGTKCLFCDANRNAGLSLNDKSFLCETCFQKIASITYPEKYEKLWREYLKEKEAHRLARDTFRHNCPFNKTSNLVGILAAGLLLLLFVHWWLFFVPVVVSCVALALGNIHVRRLRRWNEIYVPPLEPTLRHFHDPEAVLSGTDLKVMHVFDNWPGYPPFWGYLRQIVLDRDDQRCQVTGCPSRVPKHIHHKLPVSQGGEHTPSNLVTLCDFHHSIEPQAGHERIWGEIKTRYFTIVHQHIRHNPVSEGYHKVRPHVRRLELVSLEELEQTCSEYDMRCPECGETHIDIEFKSGGQKVLVTCGGCSRQWSSYRGLWEETGPRLAELLKVTRNEGKWRANWDVFFARTDTLFKALSSNASGEGKKSKSGRAKPKGIGRPHRPPN